MNDATDANAWSEAARVGQPEAQYRLGAMYFSRGEITQALDWLGQAADKHVPDAQNLLGVIHLNGIGTPCDPRKAKELFGAAAERDLKEAHFNLSGLLFSGVVVQRNDAVAIDHLLRAAKLGHRPALRVLGYLYSITDDADSQQLATRCFAQAALRGDIHSEYMLGMRCLSGAGRAINLDEGAYWLSSAANKQLYCAGQHLKLLMKKMGEPRLQEIIRQHVPEAKHIGTVKLELRAPSMKLKTDSPPSHDAGTVSEYSGALEDGLCDYLVNLAASRLLPSGVVDPATGKPLKTVLRTSSSMNFQLSMYDMVVGVVCRRLAALAGADVTHAEPISVLRYLPGEEYRPHYDHFAVDEHGAPRVRDANGQRIVTVFTYLNDVEAGGETDFPRLATRVLPGKGKAVVFLNCDASGKPNPDTLHAGMPVARGEKWLVTLWFRERPFSWI